MIGGININLQLDFTHSDFVFLIDSENIPKPIPSIIKAQRESAGTLHFYSDDNVYKKYISYIDVLNLPNFNPIKVQTEVPQSLDFILDSYVGYILGINPNAWVVIVSHDKGYTSVVKHWNALGKSVFLVGNKVRNYNYEFESICALLDFSIHSIELTLKRVAECTNGNLLDIASVCNNMQIHICNYYRDCDFYCFRLLTDTLINVRKEKVSLSGVCKERRISHHALSKYFNNSQHMYNTLSIVSILNAAEDTATMSRLNSHLSKAGLEKVNFNINEDYIQELTKRELLNLAKTLA